MSDPLTDPRVAAARARITSVERTPERFAEPTCEATDGSDNAKMRIYGRIDADGAPWGVSAQDVADALDALPPSTKRLDVHIHSRGGDAFEGLAILNQLRQAKPEVHTHVDGLAASAASAIAMAGKTITMAPSSQMMVHDASGIGIGQAADMRILADALDSISQSYAAAYAAKAGGSADDWRALMQPETWYRADEAVQSKLADTVLAKQDDNTAKPTATYDLSIFAYAGRDHAPAPKTPAEPPVNPPTENEEDAIMADTLRKDLCARLGLAEDADDATISAKLDANDQANEKAIEDLEAKIAASSAVDGKVSIDADLLDELRIAARAGQEARAVQLRQDRDSAIHAAIASGHIGAERRDHWTAKWDADPEGVRALLAEVTKGEPIYPVGEMPGYPGSFGASQDDDDKFYKSLFGDEKASA